MRAQVARFIGVAWSPGFAFVGSPVLADTYYLAQGDSMQKIEGDTQIAHVRVDCSGMEIGRSPEEVIKEVQRAYAFQRRYERWCRCSWGPESTFDVVVPIGRLSAQPRGASLPSNTDH